MLRLSDALGALLLAAALVACGDPDEGAYGSLEDEAIEKGFQRDLLLLDEELTDGSALDAAEIQEFLAHPPYGTRSALADYVSGGKSAAEAIHDAAAGHGINPL